MSASSSTTLLSQLQRLDGDFPAGAPGRRARGELIVGLLTRSVGFSAAAIALVDGERFREAARSEGWSGPDLTTTSEPAENVECRIVELKRSGHLFGRIGVEGEVDGGEELLDAIASHLALVLDSRRIQQEMREGEFQSKIQLLELESLYDIGLSIASTLNLNELTDEILMRSITLLNARSAALFLRAEDDFRMHRAFGEVSSSSLREALQSSDLEMLVTGGKPLTSEAVDLFPGCESAVAVPIRSDRGTIGVLAAADRELREGVGEFTQDDLRTLSLFAAQAAIALESARLHQQALEKQAMERELELAAMIQQDILPEDVTDGGTLEIEMWNRPARQLGGDFYALFSGEGSTTFCVADVSGKSTPAAILVSSCHAALQLLVAEQLPLDAIATRLNEHIHSWSAQNKFITLILATVDHATGTVTYVNAGHNPAFLVGGGEVNQLRSQGLPIGLLPGSRYETSTAELGAGDLLVLYSDGITEAESSDGEEYGYDRLTSILTEAAEGPLQEVRSRIVESVETFTAGEQQLDDQTIVLIRRRSE